MTENADLLTKVEALAILRGGELPDDFQERLKNFVEFYRCDNCDGVQDMNVVCRMWDEDGPSWCPACWDEQEWEETQAALKAAAEAAVSESQKHEFTVGYSDDDGIHLICSVCGDLGSSGFDPTPEKLKELVDSHLLDIEEAEIEKRTNANR